MFVGREKELKVLREKHADGRSLLIAVYGRRRVGKTALVEKAFEGWNLWKFEGIEGGTTREQLRHFSHTLRAYASGAAGTAPKEFRTWQEAFEGLDTVMPRENLVVFFDEVQWMAAMRSRMVSIFKWAWDNLFSKRRNCRFVLCGSISSFVVKKVIYSKALYGRVALEINLKPLSLSETAALIGNRWTRDAVMNAYFIIGGIPQYALELDPRQSLRQNLHTRAFSPSGYFFKEYHRLFISHFGKTPHYAAILSSLAKRPVQSPDELARSVHLKTGGTFTQLLDDLELAGFIERAGPVDRAIGKRLIEVRLSDEYLHFYFSFIERNRQAIEVGTVAPHAVLTGNLFEQWNGYAFERLCRKHAPYIARALGFPGIQYRYGPFFRRENGAAGQIDLVFIRADDTATVCEIKYVNRLTSGIIGAFEKKLAAFSARWTKNVQKVLVLGKTIPVPKPVEDYFDVILFAEKVFFTSEEIEQKLSETTPLQHNSPPPTRSKKQPAG